MAKGRYEFLIDQDGRMVKDATTAMSGMPMESFLLYTSRKAGVKFPSPITKHSYLKVAMTFKELTDIEVEVWAKTHPEESKKGKRPLSIR